MHAREPRRPERGVEQHDRRGGAEADRQHHQREADAQVAVDALVSQTWMTKPTSEV